MKRIITSGPIHHNELVGGFKNWGNDPIRRAYFSDGLVQPPTSHVWLLNNLFHPGKIAMA